LSGARALSDKFASGNYRELISRTMDRAVPKDKDGFEDIDEFWHTG
jgi:hypothetical protein